MIFNEQDHEFGEVIQAELGLTQSPIKTQGHLLKCRSTCNQIGIHIIHKKNTLYWWVNRYPIGIPIMGCNYPKLTRWPTLTKPSTRAFETATGILPAVMNQWLLTLPLGALQSVLFFNVPQQIFWHVKTIKTYLNIHLFWSHIISHHYPVSLASPPEALLRLHAESPCYGVQSKVKSWLFRGISRNKTNAISLGQLLIIFIHSILVWTPHSQSKDSQS